MVFCAYTTMLKKAIQNILRSLATKVIRRHRPRIIAITGSVGKTSTKEAIFTVVSEKLHVRRNIKNYNNELGVPLTVLGEESGGSNPLRWLGIIWRGWRLSMKPSKSYPSVLVLEMGADHPGDISYLVKIAPPTIGVITSVGPVHLEYFHKIEKVAHEKSEIIRSLPASGYAVLNADDDLIVPMRELTGAKVITYGFGESADVRAHDVNMDIESGDTGTMQIKGLRFKVTYRGSVFPVQLPGAVGRHQVYPVLAAMAVGSVLGYNAVEMTQRLERYRSPAGRMKIIPGIKQTTLIDDSYNSSPAAAKAALNTLRDLPVTGKKYAVLGDMAELGHYTEPGHREVGDRVVSCVDYLVTVGERARIISAAAMTAGFSHDQIYNFDDALSAGQFLQDRIQPGDALLVKGSQVVRMERIVKELMAQPDRAPELLVRQGPEWQR